MQIETHLGWLMTGLLAAIGAPLACGGTASDVQGGGGTSSQALCTPTQTVLSGGFERCAEGYLHRPTKGECALPTERVACNPLVDTDTTLCDADADCSSAPNGRCDSNGGICACSYPCTRDEDCGAGMACVCGDVMGAPVGAQCIAASCTSDADCAGALCASSNGACGAMSFGCFSPADECAADADCGDGYVCQVGAEKRSCVPAGCGAIGRPFLVEGEERLACPVPRADWAGADSLPDTERLDPVLRSALAQAWTRVGLMEHASVAAFARFALQLLALGAPADLVEDTHRAMADETRHARICFAFASAYAGHAVGPGALDITHALGADRFEDIVRTAIEEGCVGETLAAAEAREAAERAKDPCIASALYAIAEDEARHAALAWRFVAWAIEAAPTEDRVRIAHVLERVALRESAQAAHVLGPLELAEHGFVVGARRSALRKDVMAQVVLPCARTLAERALRAHARSGALPGSAAFA